MVVLVVVVVVVVVAMGVAVASVGFVAIVIVNFVLLIMFLVLFSFLSRGAVGGSYYCKTFIIGTFNNLDPYLHAKEQRNGVANI